MIIQWLETWRERWAELNPWWRLALVVGVLAAGGLLGAGPGYRAFRAWRLEQNLASAKVAVAEQRMDAARDLSLTVLRSGDPRIDAFRILEKSMASLRDPLHVEIARALMSHPEGSDEDRLNGFRGVAQGAPMGLAGQAWASLPESCRQRPEFAVVFAERLLAAERPSEAASVLLAVPEAARTAAVERGLIQTLLESGKVEGSDEAQRRLAAHWPATGIGLAGWLELLEEIPVQRLRPVLLAPVRRALEQAGAEEPTRRALALARLEYAADFSGRAEVIERVIAVWQGKAPVAVAQLLRDLGLHQRLLATFPVELVAEQPGLLGYLLEALEQTGAWAEVKPLLEAGGAGMAKYERLAHQAVAAGKAGDSTAMAEQWQAALADAKFSTAPDAYLTLARIAQDAGLESEAAHAMLEAVLRGRGPLPLYTQIKPLVEWLSKQGRESSLLKVCAMYLLFEPGNPVLLTQYAYLACLSSLAEPATVLQALQPLAAHLPDALPVQCVLAVAYLCNGEAAAALEVLDRQKVDLDQLAPGYRAAFLATLVLNHRIDPQDPRILGFPWQALMPSERKRFGEWLKAGAPAAPEIEEVRFGD